MSDTRIWGQANNIARRFLQSNAKRTTVVRHTFETRSYVIEFERDEDDPTWLNITTWGYDYQGLKIPETYRELVNLKMRAQLNMLDCPSDIAVRFYLDIMREVNK